MAIAKQQASRAAGEVIKMGNVLHSAVKDELPDVLARVRCTLPQLKTRVQRSYAWLLIATLKVSFFYSACMCEHAWCLVHDCVCVGEICMCSCYPYAH